MNEHDRDLATIATYMRERGDSPVPPGLLAEVRQRAVRPEPLRMRVAGSRSAFWMQGAAAIGGLAAVAVVIVLVTVVAGLPLSVAQGPAADTSPSVSGSPTPTSPQAASPTPVLSAPAVLPVMGDWDLRAGSVDGEALPMVDGHPVTLSVQPARITGQAPCISYGAKLSWRGDAFGVSEIGRRLPSCGKAVDASQAAYFAALSRVETAGLESGELVLSGDGVELRFSRVTAGPTPTPSPDPSARPSSPEPTEDWELQSGSLDGVSIPILDGHPATLEIGQDSVHGGAACNMYGADLSSSGDSFRLGEISATLIGCPEDVAASEAAYLAALGRVDTARVESGELVLSGDGVELRFRRLAPVSATPSVAPSVFQGSIAETSNHVIMLLLERTSRDRCITTVELDYDVVGLRERALELAEGAGPGPRRLAPDLYLGTLDEAIDGFRGTELLAATGGYSWAWYLARPQDADRWDEDPLPEMVAAVLLRVELPDGREVWWRNGAYVAVMPCD